MVIYDDYSTEELLFDEPCDVKDLGRIYPVRIKDYKKFQKYTQYLAFSAAHLEIKEDYKLLDTIINTIILSKCGDTKDSNKLENYMMEILLEMCDLISIITRDKISFEIIGGSYTFSNNSGSIFINGYNFNNFRNIVMKQNLLKEPKVFEDKLTQKWYEKALKAKQKNAPKIEFEDVVITVSQDMKMKLSEIKEMNIFQLYYYYYRINHVENYRAVTIFRTCSDKLPNIGYSDGILDMLYKDNDDDVFISTNALSGKL